jgi:TatD DNase family protein
MRYFQKVGKCVMPKEGVFGRVVKGGTITSGDKIIVMDNQ